MTSPRRQCLIVAALLSLGLGATVSSARACPMCADNLPSGSDTRTTATAMADDPASGAPAPALAEGFYYSILVLLGVPISLITGGGFMTYRALNKKPPTE